LWPASIGSLSPADSLSIGEHDRSRRLASSNSWDSERVGGVVDDLKSPTRVDGAIWQHAGGCGMQGSRPTCARLAGYRAALAQASVGSGTSFLLSLIRTTRVYYVRYASANPDAVRPQSPKGAGCLPRGLPVVTATGLSPTGGRGSRCTPAGAAPLARAGVPCSR
jgi:hypothetical protein